MNRCDIQKKRIFSNFKWDSFEMSRTFQQRISCPMRVDEFEVAAGGWDTTKVASKTTPTARRTNSSSTRSDEEPLKLQTRETLCPHNLPFWKWGATVGRHFTTPSKKKTNFFSSICGCWPVLFLQLLQLHPFSSTIRLFHFKKKKFCCHTQGQVEDGQVL